MCAVSISVEILSITTIDWTKSTEVFASSNVCFSSSSDTYPLNYKFNAPYNGIIQGVRLKHTSGTTTCSRYTTGYTYWGGASGVTYACGIRVKLLKILSGATISSQSAILYPTNDTYDIESINYSSNPGCSCNQQQVRTSLYDDTSSELIFYSNTTMYNVSKDDQFILGICEGVCQVSVTDNDGNSCANVSFFYHYIFTPQPTYQPTNEPTYQPTKNTTSMSLISSTHGM